MCGIAGFTDFAGQASPENQRRLETMVATLLHRGPDSAGMGNYQGVYMGMRRLAIIDLAGGKHPITTKTVASGRYTMAKSIISRN